MWALNTKVELGREFTSMLLVSEESQESVILVDEEEGFPSNNEKKRFPLELLDEEEGFTSELLDETGGFVSAVGARCRLSYLAIVAHNASKSKLDILIFRMVVLGGNGCSQKVDIIIYQ